MSKIEYETKAEDIKILGQIGNNKERFIIFQYRGELNSAFAVSGTFGGR